MVRTFRFVLIAAALLALTELLVLALAAPAGAVGLPPVRSLRVPGWTAGRIDASSHVTGEVRLVQEYASAATSNAASVETRCDADPKEFLKWTGRLAYEGAGYEQI